MKHRLTQILPLPSDLWDYRHLTTMPGVFDLLVTPIRFLDNGLTACAFVFPYFTDPDINVESFSACGRWEHLDP